MNAGVYYTAPSDVVFEEMREACIQVWSTYSDIGGYRASKVARIDSIKNVEDNFMYMLAMFDLDNQRKVIKKLSAKAKEEVLARLADGGSPESYIRMLGL